MHRLKDCIAAMSPPGVLLPGLLLVVFNSLTGHQLYHVNTLKLFLLGVMLSLLWCYNLFLRTTTPGRSVAAWQWAALLFLPTLGLLPGGWLNPADNVYFPIELITDILIVGWALLLVRQVDSFQALQGILLWLVLVIVVVTIRLSLQAFANHPLTGELIVYNRPEGSFGNVNYLASFLAVLTPVMVLLALPEHVGGKWKMTIFHCCCALAAACLLFGLMLAYSRAAIAAALLATFGSLVLVGLTSPLRPLKRLTSLVVLIGIGCLLAAVVLPFMFADLLDHYPQRFAQLYEIRSWWGRLVPLRGALDSIAASPFIGWGLGSSYNLNFTFLPVDAELFLANLSYNHLHNEWLEIGQEGGGLGWIVWAGVMATLVVAMLRFSMRQESHLLRFFALGVIGGLAAFYSHGFFSVAQRMVVSNLPLYTLIGLAGAILVNERRDRPWFDWVSWARRSSPLAAVARRLRSWHLVLVALLVMWTTFYPWIRSYGGMVQMNNRNASIAERKEFFGEWPNPYGISDMLNSQLAARQFADAFETGRMLDRIIPNYRNLPARMAEAELNMGDIEAAKELLLKQYGLSRYLPNSNLLLAAIATYQQDRQALRTHIEDLLMHALVYYHAGYDYPDQVEFHLEGDRLMLRQLPQNRVAVSLPESFFDQWLAKGKGNQLVAWVQQQTQILAADSYFLPNIPQRNNLVTLVNRWLAEPERVAQIKKQKRQLYLVANQGRNKSSFAMNADIHRINEDIASESRQQRKSMRDQANALLAETDLAPPRANTFFERIAVLQQISRYLVQVAQIHGQIMAKKTQEQ